MSREKAGNIPGFQKPWHTGHWPRKAVMAAWICSEVSFA